MSWDLIAAPGTDPDLLARVAALAHDGAGRRALRAAFDDAGLLAELATDLLPAPSAAQRRAATATCRTWTRLGVRAAVRGDPAWPNRLERSAAPPPLLAWRGPPSMPSGPAVAIVGARRATSYGTGVAAWLAEAAGGAGVTVVSGGAVGVDHAAHAAAVDHGTTVVLGCGHDVPYPRAHARPGGLFDRVVEAGGAVCSEQLPAVPPRPQHVRARNRIVAALVDVVVVVEGGPTSGSLVTATEAADAGVDVMAVPGDVRAHGSVAPHRLLREGAAPCTSPDDLLAALGVVARAGTASSSPAPGPTVLPASLLAVLSAAWPRPVPPDQLAARAGVGIGQVLAALTRARVAGVVVTAADGVRLVRAPPAAGG